MKNGIFLHRNQIKELLAFAENNNSPRQAIAGIWIDASDPKRLILEATDGCRMHQIETESEVLSPDTANVAELAEKENNLCLELGSQEKCLLQQKVEDVRAIAKINAKRERCNANIRVKFTGQSILISDYAGSSTQKTIMRVLKPAKPIQPELVGLVMHFNADYLYDALRQFSDCGVEIRLKDEKSMACLKRLGAEYPRHYLMPVMIPGKRKATG